MINYILIEAGYEVGMYTSPHLKKFNERISVNNKFITDKEIAGYFLKIKPHITSQSFFEITTAMALLYFYEKNADFAVLETGLGGRLDATNVVKPLVSVITNIGLEHTELLGNTIEKIAFEKAGIIKENVPVVTGAKGSALRIIRRISKERGAPFFRAKKHSKIKFRFLNGNFQQENKDIAMTAIDVLKKFHKIKVNEKQIIKGLQNTKWPARMQFLSKNVMVDGSHNPDGFKVLKNELSILKNQKNIENFVFVVGIQETKDAKKMLNIISPLISTIIFTKSNNPKASEPAELLRIFNEINKNNKISKKIINNPKKALNYAKKISGKNDLVVCTGSIYMVGEAI